MKKFLVVLFGLALSLGLTGCAGDKGGNVPFDEAKSIATARTAATGEAVDVIGVVTAIHYGIYNNELSGQGVYLTDKTGSIYVYGFAIVDLVEIGDLVEVSAVVADYYGSQQLSGPSLTENIGSGYSFPQDAVIQGKNIEYVSGLTSSNAGDMYEVTGTLTKNSYGSYSIESGEFSFGLYASGTRPDTFGYPEFSFLDEYLNIEHTFIIVVNGLSTSSKVRGHVLSA